MDGDTNQQIYPNPGDSAAWPIEILRSGKMPACLMTHTKVEKPERIAIGDGYLPDISEAELREMVVAIPMGMPCLSAYHPIRPS